PKLKAELAALGDKFGVRAEVFYDATDEKPSVRRAIFRAEIRSSFGLFGRIANTLTATLYSRLRARTYERDSTQLYQTAENTLESYRRQFGKELGNVIERNRSVREFFSALLARKKKSANDNETPAQAAA